MSKGKDIWFKCYDCLEYKVLAESAGDGSSANCENKECGHYKFGEFEDFFNDVLDQFFGIHKEVLLLSREHIRKSWLILNEKKEG